MLLVLLGHSKSCTMAQWNGQGAWHWSADWRSQCEVSRQQRPPPLKPLCPIGPYTLLSTFHGEGSPGNLQSTLGSFFHYFVELLLVSVEMANPY